MKVMNLTTTIRDRFRHGLRGVLALAVAVVFLVAPRPAGAADAGGELPWTHDLKKGLEQARKAGKRVFLDFTGMTCPPCKANERTVFPLPEVQQRLRKFELVKLYTDYFPKALYPAGAQQGLDDGDPADKQYADAQPNFQLMTKRFGHTGAPLYVVLEPMGDDYQEVARYNKGPIKDKGTDDTKGFIEFLDKGLTAKVAPPSPPNVSPTRGGADEPATADKLDFEVKAEPKQVRRGQVVTLTIRGKPARGFHTYPLTMRSPEQKVAQLSSIKVENAKTFQPLWPVKEDEPEFVRESTGEVLLEHKKPFTWKQDFLVSPDASPGETAIKFGIRTQVCDDHGCTPVRREFTVPLSITSEEPAAIPGELKTRSTASKPEITVKPVPENFKDASASKTGESDGLLAFALQGVFWGAISLVTPCVFPMIPITVSFFLKQSEKEHHRPLATALVYSGTIVVVLTIAAVALLSVFRAMSTHPVMNFALGGLFVFFALSLFGMYEIELPSGLAQFTSRREGSGLLGTIFMALTFTIISFACVAPFLGGFGGTAASANLGFTKILLGGFAFSVTFASPFLLLALFPAMLRRLPKSGTWLNSVKVVMGFLELAAALKFFRSGELIWSAEPQFFTYDMVMALYVALSLLCGLYLLCVYRLPHDTPLESLSVPRLLFAAAFIGLAFYLTPAMWRINDKGLTQRPSGVVFAWLDSFLLPDPVEDLNWTGNLQEALKVAREKKKRVFVDFTGEICTNCKYNERNVFPKAAVRELMEKYVLVSLYTDKVPNRFYSAEELSKFGGGTSQQEADAKANLQFQREQFNTEQLPLYVILEPTKDGYRKVVLYAEGKINSVPEFIDFLRKGLIGTGK
jgi:thiol:disulfide interchange protein